MTIGRTLLVAKILKERTNKRNPTTLTKLMEYLECEGYTVTRNTVKADISDLMDNGYRIVEFKGRHNVSNYYIEEDFSLEECRIILDAVNSNKFVRSELKRNIRDKILSNISYYDRGKLRNSITTETLDTGNIDVSENIFILHKAITDRVFVNFIKVSRDINKKIISVKKVEGFIPKEIYYYNDRYYLIGINIHNDIRFYRIDRISQIATGDHHSNHEKVDLKNFGIKNFDMFGADKIENIQLKVHNSLINSIVEKFGENACMHKCSDNDQYFMLSIQVGINSGLVRWILKQGSLVKVISPTKLIDEIICEINRIHNLYKSH